METANSKTVYQLSDRSRRAAVQLMGGRLEPADARVAYVNALARMAVGTHLRSWGFEVSLRRPASLAASFPPVPASLADRAHIHVRGVGVLECRPLLPGQSAAILPLQARYARVGAILVEVSEVRASLEILGFVRGAMVPRYPRMPVLPLLIERRVLESLSALKEYLAAIGQAATAASAEQADAPAKTDAKSYIQH